MRQSGCQDGILLEPSSSSGSTSTKTKIIHMGKLLLEGFFFQKKMTGLRLHTNLYFSTIRVKDPGIGFPGNRLQLGS